jgi:hypothetical protein
MKTKMKFLTIILALVITAGISQKQASAQPGRVSFQLFYDQLSPYGQWIDYRNYGYVWFPDAGPNFVPYSTGGHWALSNYGWTWVSNYNWGWAPFHYGRWDFDNMYGWFWVPDTEWGPSWVDWRRADGYYGWRPMGSRFSISFGNNNNSYNDHWMFVRDRYIGKNNIDRYYANRNDYDRIFSISARISNTYFDRTRNTSYVSGPTGADVLRDAGTRIKPVTIQEYNQPGQDLRGSQLRLYRPQVINSSETALKPAPTRITDMNEIKRSYEKNSSIPRRDATPNDYNRSNPPPVKMNQQNINRNEQPVNMNRENINKNDQPMNMNQQNINKNDPPVNMNQQNINKNDQPLQPQNVNPPKNDKQEGLQNTENQQNNNNVKSQPVQSKRENPSVNNKQEKRSNKEKQKKNKNN